MNYKKIIVLVSDGVYGVHAGAGMSNNRFLKCLVKLGYGKKLIVCPIYTSKNNPNFSNSWFKKTEKYLHNSGVKITPIQDGSHGKSLHGNLLIRKIASNNAFLQIKKILKGQRTLVISFDTTFIELLKYLSNIKGITHVHIPRSTALHGNQNDLDRVIYEKECFKYVLSTNTFIGVTGKFMRIHLINDYLIPSKKIIDITNGVLLNDNHRISFDKINKTLKGYGLDINNKFILSYGRANYYKGFHILIKALGKIKELIRPELFLIATTTDTDSEYVNYLKELWVKNKIRGAFLTKFDQELPKILQQSNNLHSIVVPSISEPFGLIPIEIFANKHYKAPVISSNVGGLKYQVINDITGFTFKNKSINELALRIYNVFNLSEMKSTLLSENSLKLVKDKFNYLKNVESFMVSIDNLSRFHE